MYPNWTKQQQKKSRISKFIDKRLETSTIHYLDVMEDGMFISRGEREVSPTTQDRRWLAIQKGRPPGVRVRVLFVDSLSGPVLQMLGTRYNIEPFFFSSAIGWIPARYQSHVVPNQSDHTDHGSPSPNPSYESAFSRATNRSPDLIIDTQAPLPLRSNGILLLPDLLALHMVRSHKGSTIISLHPEPEHRGTTAEALHQRVQFTGRSVYWSNIFKDTTDPTFIFLSFLWYALYAWDETLERLYRHICFLETQIIITDDIHMTHELHVIRAHLLHYEALLHDFKKTVMFVMDTPNPGILARSSEEEGKAQSAAIMERECKTLLTEINRLQVSRDMQDKRLKNVMNLGFSRIAIEDSRRTQRLTEAAMKDSAALKQISYLTMAFIPASFVAAVFGMNVTVINPESFATLPQYVVAAISLTLLTIWIIVAYQIQIKAPPPTSADAGEKDGGEKSEQASEYTYHGFGKSKDETTERFMKLDIWEPPPSGDEEDDDEDDELLSSSSHQTPAPPQPILKRKESDWRSQPIPKRPKHSQQALRSEPNGSRRQAESVSAPVRQTNGARPPYPSTSSSSTSVPGSSKGATPSLTVPSTSGQSASSMLPPLLPSRNTSPQRRPSSEVATIFQTSSSSSRNANQSSARKPISTLTSMPRPRPYPISKKDIPSSLPRELFSIAASSSRKASSANTFGRLKPKSKPMPSDEIIEISDDEPSPPRPKAPLPSSEIIEIFDSSDEESAAPPARAPALQRVPLDVPTGPSYGTKAGVMEERAIAGSSRSNLSQKDSSDGSMDVVFESSTLRPSQTPSLLQPSFVPTIPMKPTDKDQRTVVDRIEEPADSTLSATRVPSTPTSASYNKDAVQVKSPTDHTPSSAPPRMSTGSPKSARVKPISRQGFAAVSTPPSAGNHPSPSKPRLQQGVKSASAPFRPPKEALPSSPSNSAGTSEAQASSRQVPRANSDDAGIDMRNLNEALGLDASSSRPQTPENPVTVKAQPISPEIPKPPAARNLVLERPKFVARKSSGGRIPAPQIPLRESGTAEMPIDLTSDNEDEGPRDVVMKKARESAKTLVKLVTDLTGKKLEAFAPPSKQQPSTGALLPEPSSSRASTSTDELALRSAGVSASPPPRSASPQSGSPGIPVATKSPEVQNEVRRNSFPLGKEPSNWVVRSSSPLSRPATGSRSPSTKRPDVRPPSSASMPQVSTALSSLAKSAIGSLQSVVPSASSSHTLPVAAPALRYTPTSSVSTPSVSPVRATQTTSVASTENVVQETSHAVVMKIHAPQTLQDPAAVAARLASRTLSEDEATEVQQLIAETDDEMEDMQTKDDALMDVDSDEEMPPETSADASKGSEMGEALEDDVPDSSSLDDLALPRDPVDPTGPMDTPSDDEDSRASSASLPPGRRRSSRRSSHSSSENGANDVFDDDFGLSVSALPSRSTTPEDVVLDVAPKKSYGGFAAVTWAEYRKDPNNFRPKVYRARDLPHTLQDHVNRMVNSQETPHGARELFEAMINENTADDEPHAPHIRVENNVDDEATPPWEFYYSNKMWHGEGVPDPDIKGLVSCDCRGGCNPKSKTCACLKRQRDAVKDKDLVVEFAYDKNGKLKVAGYPVFECNELCGCSEECRNRVVQHGRKVEVHIRKTESKGWGVFAGDKKIPQGTFIGIYSGELLLDTEAHARGVNYNKFGRTYLFDLDFHHLKSHLPKEQQQAWTSQFTVDAYHAGNIPGILNLKRKSASTIREYIQEKRMMKKKRKVM
ncbi:hypothetical protein NLJ89_g3406 [Agrocybe chaxingu]|uniref:Pre-SET domain-containing protein n=1 Tax=Agrocybe chaxingu TaxID=84603 RepID=A0A9W8K4Y2_9AGAR|nr:hypothetical protein NLJ89_g3406 [Agrocybe chaxingu]